MQMFNEERIGRMRAPARINIARSIYPKFGFWPERLNIHGSGFTMSFLDAPYFLESFGFDSSFVRYWVVDDIDKCGRPIKREVAKLDVTAKKYLEKDISRLFNDRYTIYAYMGRQMEPMLNIRMDPKFKYFDVSDNPLSHIWTHKSLDKRDKNIRLYVNGKLVAIAPPGATVEFMS